MILNYDGKDMKLPDFLIVGAAKSGTTSLHYYLDQHKDIFMPRKKELVFFSFMDISSHIVERYKEKPYAALTLDEYASHFSRAAKNQVIGEACPYYLYKYRDTIKNIRIIYGERHRQLKIIIVLRNPAERAWSHFIMMYKRDRIEPMDFHEAIEAKIVNQRLQDNPFEIGRDYIGGGMYYEQVKAFVDEFPAVRVFLYEELSENILKVVKDIFSFLSVDTSFTPDVGTRFNVSGEVRSRLLHTIVEGQYPLKSIFKSLVPHQMRKMIKYKLQEKNVRRQEMPSGIKKELTMKYFKDDILKLEALLKKNLSMWLDTP